MIDLRPVATALAGLLRGTDPTTADDPTPCGDWDVAALVAHLDLVSGGAQDPRDGEDLGARLSRTADQVVATALSWQDPDAWVGRTVDGGLDLGNEEWGLITLTEIVVHGWDLARATDRRWEPPTEAVEACMAHVERFVPDAPVPALWGDRVAVDSASPALDRALAVTGRDPQWSPSDR